MSKLTVQEMNLDFTEVLADNGCMLMQAYDTEKGAGNHESVYFLRAIGPEPWNAAECWSRLADRLTARYGEKIPTPRLYQHHQFQFQVVMKPPSPEIFKELYLESLRLLGIDPLRT